MGEYLRKTIVENLDWLKQQNTWYRECSHFSGDSNVLCEKIKKIKDRGRKLPYGLGIRYIVDSILSPMKNNEAGLDEYQEPLSLLSQTGKYNDDIVIVDGVYTSERLKKMSLVLDPDGTYHYVNKLNTNYRDITEMLTQLLVDGGKLDDLKDLTSEEIYDYLFSIKKDLKPLILKYLKSHGLLEFTRNSINNTSQGDRCESYVEQRFNEIGIRTLYRGGNGDFIDMIYGTDLIISHKGINKTCQVKCTSKSVMSAIKNPQYSKIDYFICVDEYRGDVIVFNKEGNNFTIKENGKIVTNEKVKV